MCSEQDLNEIKKTWGKLPKVLVGSPTANYKDYCLERFAERIKELDYPNYDILMADNSRDEDHVKILEKAGLPVIKTQWFDSSRGRLCVARNELRKRVLDNDYDFFFDLESDVIPPKDVLTRLLKHGKKVVGGWYYIGQPNEARPCLSRGWKRVEKKGGFMMGHEHPLGEDLAKDKLLKGYLGSMGVCLIHKDILEQIKFRVVEQMRWHDDSFFYYDCDKKKIDVYTDTDLLCPHFQSGWSGVKW